MYVASSILILVAVIMGVTTLNNFGKMKAVQKMMSQVSATVLQESDEENVQPVSGKVTEVVQETSEEVTETDPMTSPTTEEEVSEKETVSEEAKEEETSQEVVNEQGEGDASDGVYVVEQGDTLAIISRKAYGDVSHVDSICSMNGITDGNLIYVGQKLLLP